MNFFCTKEHLKEYQRKMVLKDENIYCLDAHQGLQVAAKLFGLR